LLFQSNAVYAGDTPFNEDHDFWQQVQKDDLVHEKRRAMMRHDEDKKKLEEDDLSQRKRRDRIFAGNDYSARSDSDDNFDKKDIDSIFRHNSDKEYKLADKKEWQKLSEAHDLLGDWVPSRPDRESNGGFGTNIGNGRPVPYKLNGHIEIERKLPWEADN
jgi:hypothetical protein